LPTQALPTALCRLPRGFAVGKAFVDWVYAFADRGKQSAKRRFPVVYLLCCPPHFSLTFLPTLPCCHLSHS
jgi:hypothetical protein